MRGAGFVTKRNSDRVLLFFILFFSTILFYYVIISALGALRLEQYHIVYFIVKWPYVLCFFSKITKPSPSSWLHFNLNFIKTIVFMKINPQTRFQKLHYKLTISNLTKKLKKNTKFRRKSEKRTTSRTPP